MNGRVCGALVRSSTVHIRLSLKLYHVHVVLMEYSTIRSIYIAVICTLLSVHLPVVCSPLLAVW